MSTMGYYEPKPVHETKEEFETWKKKLNRNVNKALKFSMYRAEATHKEFCDCKDLWSHTIYCRNCLQTTTDYTQLWDRCPNCDAKVAC